MRFLGQFHARKNFLALSNLPHFGGFSPLKGPPWGGWGAIRGHLGPGQKGAPSHQEKTGGQKFFAEMDLDPVSHSLLRVFLPESTVG